MAECYIKDLKKQLPCAVHLKGEYGANDIYAGVPVIIGSKGVEKVIELDLQDGGNLIASAELKLITDSEEPCIPTTMSITGIFVASSYQNKGIAASQ